MSNQVDLQGIFTKLDAMFDRANPGFVHAIRRPRPEKGRTELVFPSGFRCTTNSSPIEAELMYNEIFVREEYLRTGIDLSNLDTVIDVGANMGMFTMYLLENFRGVRVHSIEPMPDTFEVFRENLSRFPGRSVHAYNTALGSETDSRMEISFFPFMTGNSTAHLETKEDNKAALSGVFTKEEIDFICDSRTVTVPSTTLSSIIDGNGIDRIDLLKIDTEGSEAEILKGIEARHWKLIRQLALEVHDRKEVLPLVVEILSSNGMETRIDEAAGTTKSTLVLTASRR
jgi:FkbM family methyltransferase